MISEWSGTDALLPDRDAQGHIAPRNLDPGNGQRIDEARRVDAAVRHVAGPGVARQVVQLVHIERAGKHPAQQPVGRRQICAVGIDEVGDPPRIDAPRVFQNGGDLRSLDQAPAAAFVRDDRRSQLFDRVGERIVPDVVQQCGGDSHPRIAIG